MARRKHAIRSAVLVCLLLLLFFLLLWIFGEREKTTPSRTGMGQDTAIAVTADTSILQAPDTAAGDTASARVAPANKPPVKRIAVRPLPAGTTPEAGIADSISQPGDTVAEPESIDSVGERACARDTVAPWVYPDPSGGLHRGEVSIRLVSSEPCAVEWRFDGEKEWRVYSTGETIMVEKSGAVRFWAVDTCGNRMPEREEFYEVQPRLKSAYCPEDMEYIEVHETRFCIDRYEWPNKRKRRPQAYVSVYHAMDSCFSVGKRLCTMGEWIVACGGPHGWDYPYGDAYEPYGCASEDTVAKPSGTRRECRGYFDVYDMSGNLAEWTNTRSSKNSRYYNVMGGFWQSGVDATCRDVRYSYFPENRHNPVGFRCCKDASAVK